jgi:hypothetical protein
MMRMPTEGDGRVPRKPATLRRMGARVSFSDGAGGVWELGPGDMIGRASTASLRLNDPRVSEAHALVSLRGSSLRLLALRGRFAVRGQVVTEAELQPGLSVEFASGLALEVTALSLPGEVLALELPNGERLVPPKVASLTLEAHGLTLTSGADPSALATVWSDEDALWVRRPGVPDEPLAPGDQFEIAGLCVSVRSVALTRSAVDATNAAGPLERPLHLTLGPESVAVRAGTETTPVTIDGVPARIVHALAASQGASEWRTLAQAIWPVESDPRGLRQKWDAGLARLRKRLVELHIRRDLVRTDGTGRFELLLGPRDTLEGQRA